MNYLYERFVKPIVEKETFCNFSSLTVQVFSLKLMYNGITVKDKYQQMVEHGQRFNFYPTVKLPGATLYNVKTFENIGNFNQIRIENMKLDIGGRVILNIYRGENAPDDTNELISDEVYNNPI